MTAVIGTGKPVVSPHDDVRLPDSDLVVTARTAVDLAGILSAHGPYHPLLVR
jgi:hypothetical protein